MRSKPPRFALKEVCCYYTRAIVHRKWWREHISTHTPQNCAMCARWLVCVLWIIARVRGCGERKSEKRVCEKIIKKTKQNYFSINQIYIWFIFRWEKLRICIFFFNHLHFSSFTYVHSPQRNTRARAIVITSTIILRYCHHITPCMREWVQRIYKYNYYTRYKSHKNENNNLISLF